MQINHRLQAHPQGAREEEPEEVEEVDRRKKAEYDWLVGPTLPVSQKPTRRLRQRIEGNATEERPQQRDVASEAVAMWTHHEWKPSIEEENAGPDFGALHWWKKYAALHPEIADLARRRLSTQASSATSERSFSKAGLILTKKRMSLIPGHVDGLTLLGWHCHEQHMQQQSDRELSPQRRLTAKRRTYA